MRPHPTTGPLELLSPQTFLPNFSGALGPSCVPLFSGSQSLSDGLEEMPEHVHPQAKPEGPNQGEGHRRTPPTTAANVNNASSPLLLLFHSPQQQERQGP